LSFLLLVFDRFVKPECICCWDDDVGKLGGCTDLLWLEDGAVAVAGCGGCTDHPWLEDGVVAGVPLGTFAGYAGFCLAVPSDVGGGGGSLQVDLLCPLCLHLLHFIPHLALFI